MVLDARKCSELIWLQCSCRFVTQTEAKGECISCAPNDAIFQNMCITFPEGLDVYSVKTHGSTLCLLQ